MCGVTATTTTTTTALALSDSPRETYKKAAGTTESYDDGIVF